ncbi:MAG: FecR domain-containing protein [Candidatus Omnitrophica bacterium]|nr:FecR domain-containing protein [Candidatus Omnitrophota bacterium]
MKKLIIVVVILLMSAGFCLAQSALKERMAKVVKVDGDVQVMFKNSDAWQKAEEEMVLSEGDVIKTGKVGAALLNIEGDSKGSLVRLRENTTLNLDILKEDSSSKKKVTVLDLSIGKILIQAEKLQEGSRFEVKTPTSVVGVRGTKFAVEVDTLE